MMVPQINDGPRINDGPQIEMFANYTDCDLATT